MRQAPWYQEWLTKNGLKGEGDQYGNVQLNDKQRAELMALALKNGIGLNHKYDMIDANGQIAEEHHKLKKIAIAAAIGGLAVTGMGAAGIGPLAGVLGGTAGAAGAGGVAAGEVGADVAGASALEGGLLAGGVLPGAMATLPEVGGAIAGTAAAASPFLTSAAIPGVDVTTMGASSTLPGVVAGSVPSGAVSAAEATPTLASSLMNGAKTAMKGKSTLDDVLNAAGKGAGDASTAAGQNRLDQEKLGLEAAPVDLAQRRIALQDVARASGQANPRISPFDPVGARPISPQYQSTLSMLAQQGQNRLQSPLSTVSPSTLQDATGTQKGTLEKIGDYAGPTMTVASKIPWDKIFG
jgi:hypothetical protein